jgi:carnitine O-acetyltransferase
LKIFTILTGSYLFGRESIAINVNYFFAFEDDPVPAKNNQVGRAASLLRGALLFKMLLDSQRLEPDMERDKPLDMSQHPRLFAATRIPGEIRDSLVTYTTYRPGGR